MVCWACMDVLLQQQLSAVNAPASLHAFPHSPPSPPFTSPICLPAFTTPPSTCLLHRRIREDLLDNKRKERLS